ncbi:hypothetical protein L2E82_31482 [Cichorium intybus]|uniref:Uncharacterized protein n=1 Tax=Cichorium intybus TaxID=13427 RepID=A0ACB9BEV1_CICIN|nr:hypothetical protein L2E82_31482 [Cichorium intybus]
MLESRDSWKQISGKQCQRPARKSSSKLSFLLALISSWRWVSAATGDAHIADLGREVEAERLLSESILFLRTDICGVEILFLRTDICGVEGFEWCGSEKKKILYVFLWLEERRQT